MLMVVEGFLIFLLLLKTVFAEDGYGISAVKYATDEFGHSRFRPWDCCIACGDEYSYFEGRCLYDPGNLVRNHHFSSDKHQPWMTGSDACCFFCGFTAGDFTFLKSEKKCVQRHQLQHSFQSGGNYSLKSFSSAKCAVCEMVMKTINGMKDIALNKVERELQGICDITFFFSHFCHHLIESNMDQIKSFLENRISSLNLCSRFSFCSSSTTLRSSTAVFNNHTTTAQLRGSETDLQQQILNLAFPITITASRKSFKYQIGDWNVAKVFTEICAALNRHRCEKLCILSSGSKIEFFNEELSFKSLLPFSINNKNNLELLICD